jgi:hypothetical protein
VLTFRLAVVHSLPSAIRLEEAIVPDRFWSLAEPCVEPAPPTNPNVILSAIATAPIRLVVMLSSPPWCGRGVCLRTCDVAALNGGSLTRIAAKRRSVQQPARPHRRPSPTQLEVTCLRAMGRSTLALTRPSSASARRTMPDRQRGLELRRHLRRAPSPHGCQRGKCSFAPAIVLDPCHVARCRGSVDSKLVP